LWLAIVSATLFSGCAVSIAPGYHVQKESLTVRFVPGSRPHLAVTAVYRLKNVGMSSLNFIDVNLPGVKSFGRTDLRVQINGRETAAHREKPVHTEVSASEPQGLAAPQSFWRISLSSAWYKKQSILINFKYDLDASHATDPRIFVGTDAFYLNDSGWMPALQEPKALFGFSLTRANSTSFTVVVPPYFRVYAGGRPRGITKRNSETGHRFQIRLSDFDAYVFAGRYQQKTVTVGSNKIQFWTLQPAASTEIQKSAAEISDAASFYNKNFGQLPKSVRAFYDIQLPPQAPANSYLWRNAEASLLPGTVYSTKSRIHDTSFFWQWPAKLLSVSPFSIQLAHTWFGHLIFPHGNAWMLGEGLSFYAATSVAQGGQARAKIVQSVLTDYSRRHARAVEKPIASISPDDPDAQLRLGADKMSLFFFALEDRCGSQNVTHAIAHMVYSLRGQAYGYSDFRAALEEECQQHLAPVFRRWLDQAGIPRAFRARYMSAGAALK